MKILADARLPELEACFSEPFQIDRYQSQEELESLIKDYDILICRSTLQVNAKLLEKANIKSVATASSGIDHIDQDYLQSRGISLLDAKGSNAKAVADYVCATLAYLELRQKIPGKKAGIIGYGAVGFEVCKRLLALGYEVICYDPYRAELKTELEELFDTDVLCIHANLHDLAPYPSRNMINEAFLNRLKPESVIINAARGGIVNEIDLLQNQNKLCYCTDVYSNEPNINPAIVDFAYLCTPHIAGHSIEAKQEAVFSISRKLQLQFNHTVPVSTSLPQDLIAGLTSFKSCGRDLGFSENWQSQILSLYNPETESLALKKAQDKKTSFLTLRQAHQSRHDFDWDLTI